ncbi:MAG: response regulator [Candidatus Cloacimonadota bacterium]|nr:response regulator [Candidatus Cloacimonadota bacterium]
MYYKEKILFVDDDSAIRAAYRHRLQKNFHIEFAVDGEDGLRLMKRKGPFAVIVTDMRMPKMNGIELLTEVRELFPDTVRMMLTGYADLQTALKSVNEGNIYQFLTKPCNIERLSRSLENGIGLYRHITAEKELIEKTLQGSVEMLTEMLSLLKPEVHSRASRIRDYVRDIVKTMKLEKQWQYELSALLSQIGCLTIPTGLLEKVYAGDDLTQDEKNMYKQHPIIAHNLLRYIPRLESVAEIIKLQNKTFSLFPANTLNERLQEIELGAQILHVVIDFDTRIVRGSSKLRAINAMEKMQGAYNREILTVLDNLGTHQLNRVVKKVSVSELRNSMIIKDDVYAKNNVLLVSSGRIVTDPILELLRSFSEGIGVIEPIRVSIVV